MMTGFSFSYVFHSQQMLFLFNGFLFDRLLFYMTGQKSNILDLTSKKSPTEIGQTHLHTHKEKNRRQKIQKKIHPHPTQES